MVGCNVAECIAREEEDGSEEASKSKEELSSSPSPIGVSWVGAIATSQKATGETESTKKAKFRAKEGSQTQWAVPVTQGDWVRKIIGLRPTKPHKTQKRTKSE